MYPFKLVIPASVQKKIDHVCSKINNIEWSGTLFYNTEGSWANKDLVVTITNFYLQDIGNAASTSFEMGPDVVGYCVDNDLLGDRRGLIHSHHNMEAFFSGTDINTLKEEALDYDHFLSLVVNNRRKYVAAITSVIDSKRTITELNEFTTFDGDKVTLEANTYEEEEKFVEYTLLDIEIEDYENSHTELDTRIEELKEAKKKTVIIPATNYKNPYINPVNGKIWVVGKGWEDAPKAPPTNKSPNSIIPKSSYDNINKGKEVVDFGNYQSLIPFGDSPFEEDDVVIQDGSSGKDLGKVEIDNRVIKQKAIQLVTLSMFVPLDSSINLLNIIEKLPGFVKNAFPNDPRDYGIYVDTISEYIIMDSSLAEAHGFNTKQEESEFFALVAHDIEEYLMLIAGESITNAEFVTLLETIRNYQL